jgi:penicillin amidase
MKKLWLALSLVVCAPALTFAQQAALNNSSIKLVGLKNPVTIRRDARGIAYVEASNDEDLMFAQGFVTAQDRLWQMDLLRRTSRGRLAEIFGRPALEQDKLHRLYGFDALADQVADRLPAPQRALLEAYARGVNAYMATLDDKALPVEFRLLQYRPNAWRASDSISVLYIFGEALSTTWRIDLMRAALRDVPPDKLAKLLPDASALDVFVVGSDKGAQNQTNKIHAASPINVTPAMLGEIARIEEIEQRSLERVGLFIEGGAASNNWVVAGKRTVTGKPLLANDPHLPSSAPGIWHLVNLSAPGVRVAGVTAPGLPGVVIGHNEFIAWGFTNLGPDVQDLYLERFDAQNPRMYQTPAGLRAAEIRHEEIKVRKVFTNPETENAPFDVTVTRHGPIIFEKDGARYALKWTIFDADLVGDALSAIFMLDRAKNWNEFRAALAHFRAPATQNVVYADVNGHIGYYGAGAIPIRRSGDGSVPYDGATDAGEWTGLIPFDELPHVLDPPSGIIVTANGRVVGKSYKHFLTHEWAQPYRARRIYNLLDAKQNLSVEDFESIQGDTFSIAGATFAHEAAKILSSIAAKDEQTRAAIDLLKNWDGKVNADSRAALVVNEWRGAFRQRILNAAIGEARASAFGWAMFDVTTDEIITERPRAWLPKEFQNSPNGYADLLVACLQEARENLTKRFGADETKWTWGNFRKVNFPHPLTAIPLIGAQFLIPPFPQNGSGGGGVGPTPNVGQNVSMRFIADVTDWDRTRHGIPLGESGDPQSAHWKDQLDDWRSVTPSVFPFTSAAVERAAKETLRLEPMR